METPSPNWAGRQQGPGLEPELTALSCTRARIAPPSDLPLLLSSCPLELPLPLSTCFCAPRPACPALFWLTALVHMMLCMVEECPLPLSAMGSWLPMTEVVQLRSHARSSRYGAMPDQCQQVRGKALGFQKQQFALFSSAELVVPPFSLFSSTSYLSTSSTQSSWVASSCSTSPLLHETHI